MGVKTRFACLQRVGPTFSKKHPARGFPFLLYKEKYLPSLRCLDVEKVSVHGDDPSEVTPGQFRRFLVDSPLIRETIGGKMIRPRKPSTRRGPSSRPAVMLDDESKVMRLFLFEISFRDGLGGSTARSLLSFRILKIQRYRQRVGLKCPSWMMPIFALGTCSFRLSAR